MSEIFSEAELRELASIGAAGRTNLKRLITSHRKLQAEMDALKRQLADCHTHLEAQRQQTYQSVEREQALKRQLAETKAECESLSRTIDQVAGQMPGYPL